MVRSASIATRRGGSGGAPAIQRCRLWQALLAFIVITFSSYAVFITKILRVKETHRLPLSASAPNPPPVRNSNTTISAATTPPCKPHTQPKECTDNFCQTVRSYIKGQNSKGMWNRYYPNVLQYYKCINAKKVVEVGAAFGGQTRYMLKNTDVDVIEEYHVVDPFMAGYDNKDPMSRWMQNAVPDAKPEDISTAWYKSISLTLGTLGEYGNDNKTEHPAGCRLRMHRLTSVEGAKLFANYSVDAVFIDGLHTYQGVVDDINAWRDKVKPNGGGALIFNDYEMRRKFGGISRAVKEEAERTGATPFMIDKTNAVLGGKAECATKHVPF